MRLLFVAVCHVAISSVAVPAQADALLQRALAPASDDAQRVWSVQRTALDYDDNGQLKTKTIAQYDGARVNGKRWSLLSVNGILPTKSQAADFDEIYKRNALPPTYALVKTVVPADAVKQSESDAFAQYRVTSLPVGSTAIRGLDLSKYTIADVVVDKRGPVPFISEVRVYAPKEFRPIAGAKVKKLERLLRFTMGKDGIPVLSEHSMTSDASMLFKSITLRTVAQFSHQQSLAHLSTANLRAAAIDGNPQTP